MKFKVGDKVKYISHEIEEDEKLYVIDKIYVISQVNKYYNEYHFEGLENEVYINRRQLGDLRYIVDTKLARKMYTEIHDEIDGFIGVFK